MLVAKALLFYFILGGFTSILVFIEGLRIAPEKTAPLLKPSYLVFFLFLWLPIVVYTYRSPWGLNYIRGVF